MNEQQKTAFLEDQTELLKKHGVENMLIVYVSGGLVHNTTLNAVKNEAAEVLNNISDTINSYFINVN